MRPQKVWWVDDPTQPVWFSVEDANTQQRLPQQPGLVKLVNCEEGEESDYAGKDSILKMLDQKDDVFQNVLGPMRAKGLEFPAVVLYRFAETAPDGFLDLLTGKSDVSEEPERQLPFQYFLNRLYVAASRAKRQLFVVDQGKEFDNEGFWKFATDFNVVKNLVQRTANKEDWGENHDHFIPLVKGLEGAWTGQRIDPGEQGKEYAAQGRRNRDPYLMRQAALAFESAGNKIEAERCKAGAEEFEGKLREAGDRYRESDFFEKAFECYWQGRVFDRICDLAASRPDLSLQLKGRAADFAVRGNDVPAARSLLEEISKAAEDREWRYEASKDTTWRVVLARLVECLAKAIKDHTQPWQQVYATLRQLMDKRLSLPEQHMAPIAYAAGEYADAVEIWERVRETDREEYRKAKARSTPFPENVVWFGRAKEYAEVLKKWQAHRSEIRDLSRLKNDVVHAVVDAAFGVKDLNFAPELLVAKPARKRAVELLERAQEEKNRTLVVDAACIFVRFFVRSRSWEEVVNAAERTDFGKLLRAKGRAERGQPKARKDLLGAEGAAAVLRAAVEALARSEELVNESSGRQQVIAEFLNRTFIASGASPDRRGLRPEVVGAAIERAGKIVDALRYYENLERDTGTSEDIQRFAAERLVRNLERYAEYLSRQRDEKQVQKREERAEKIRQHYQLGSRPIPDYPIREEVGRNAGGPSEWMRGPFKFTLSRSHARLRIEHTERFEIVTVYAQEKELCGEVAIESLGGTKSKVTSWRIPDWNTTIRLIDTVDGYTVNIRRFSEDFNVELPKQN